MLGRAHRRHRRQRLPAGRARASTGSARCAHHYVDPLGWECLERSPPTPSAAPVGAGGIVVFSSLTPHLTGPNTTDAVRKAYILQYAPDGAVVLQGDSSAPSTGSASADDPDRQFPVLVAGEPDKGESHG